MKNANYLYSDLSQEVIGAFYQVYNNLGFGFLEKVYENALKLELSGLGIQCKQQERIDVYYRQTLVGEYYADLMIENKIIVELKSAEKLIPAHEAQLVNYLRASKVEVGLLLNFGKKPEHKRRVLTNDYKGHL